MSHRADLNSLSAPARQSLVNVMLQYLDDSVIANHMNIIHSGIYLFVGHRVYIAGMEAFLSANGGGGFVPLAMWKPENPIPPEFNVVKPEDNGRPRPPLMNLNPGISLPSQFRFPAVCSFENGDDLGNAVNGWHGGVHITVGGTMADIMISPAAPIFWCWHAFLDHLYWEWQRCLVATGQPGGSQGAGRPEEPPPDSGAPARGAYNRWHAWYKRAYPHQEREA